MEEGGSWSILGVWSKNICKLKKTKIQREKEWGPLVGTLIGKNRLSATWGWPTASPKEERERMDLEDGESRLSKPQEAQTV